RACFDLAWPTDENRHTPSALPIGVLFATVWSDAPVWPAVVVRAVIGGVHDDCIISDTQLVELREHPANILVMCDHHVVIVALTALTLVLRRAMRPEMHSSGIVP